MAIAELTRNAVDVLPKGALEEKLKLGRPLRVKLGIDVTSPDIHVGRAIPLQRMRAFQDEGHTGVLIIGDYTTRIGDPSGRSAERIVLAGRDVLEAYGFEQQVVLTTPLLVSWDRKKMSSSEGNNIPLTMDPEEQFGRAMRIPDELLPEWYRLVMEREPPIGDPLEAKLELARFIVRRSHGEEGVRRGEEHFTRVVREG